MIQELDCQINYGLDTKYLQTFEIKNDYYGYGILINN